MHGHPFDAKHTFKVNRFTDIERFANLEETYIEPKVEEYTAKVCMSFTSFCAIADCAG
jgi:translation initiation factor 3 subunit B